MRVLPSYTLPPFAGGSGGGVRAPSTPHPPKASAAAIHSSPVERKPGIDHLLLMTGCRSLGSRSFLDQCLSTAATLGGCRETSLSRCHPEARPHVILSPRGCPQGRRI